jgi:hypothetical protein
MKEHLDTVTGWRCTDGDPLGVREVTNPYPGKSLRHQEGFYTPSILSLTPLPLVAIWDFSRLVGPSMAGILLTASEKVSSAPPGAS